MRGGRECNILSGRSRIRYWREGNVMLRDGNVISHWEKRNAVLERRERNITWGEEEGGRRVMLTEGTE